MWLWLGSKNIGFTCTHHREVDHHHHHLFLNREGSWSTTDDFTTSFLILIPKHLVRDHSLMSVPLPGTVYRTVSAILTLRHYLDRLWKPISFNKVSNFLLLFLWRFSSVQILYYVLVCVCMHACMCVHMCLWCVCECVCVHLHVSINFIGEWFDVLST